jgi:hypothetical protein
MERPQNWIEFVNAPDNASELDDLRSSVQRGRPFGSADWVIVTDRALGSGLAIQHSTYRAKISVSTCDSSVLKIDPFNVTRQL